MQTPTIVAALSLLGFVGMGLLVGQGRRQKVIFAAAFALVSLFITIVIGPWADQVQAPFFERHPEGMFALGGVFSLLTLAATLRFISRFSDFNRLLLLGAILFWAIAQYATMYAMMGICSDSDCLPANIRHDWLSGLYFSIVTFTTTGYGDYHPQESGRLLAASEALAGYIFFGLFVSLLASYFSRQRNSN